MAKDPYQELGITRQASADEVQKAFRKLAKQYHPDRNPGNAQAEARFKQISGAFELLKDPVKRAKFDRGEIDAEGHDNARGFNPGGGFRAQPQGQGGFGGTQFEGLDLDEIFDIFGGGAAQTARGRTSRAQATKGADVKIKLDIDLLDSISGNTRRVVLSDGRALDIAIPKGAQNDQVLRLKGQGQASPMGGMRGDVLVELRIRPHPVYQVDGVDLHMDLWVSVPDAILGAKLECPTPEGPVSLNLPAGSPAGTVLRLKGRGGIDAKTINRGDLMVRILLALPDQISDELTQFARNWREQAPYRPQAPAQRKKT